jgi:hypothetical protein
MVMMNSKMSEVPRTLDFSYHTFTLQYKSRDQHSQDKWIVRKNPMTDQFYIPEDNANGQDWHTTEFATMSELVLSVCRRYVSHHFLIDDC